MGEVLKSADLHLFGLKVIAGSTGWFKYFASTAVREAMLGSDAEASLALRILSSSWKTDSEEILHLIKEQWLPHSAKDSYSWIAIRDCPNWTAEVEQIAGAVLKRTARSEEHTSELQSLMRISYAVF